MATIHGHTVSYDESSDSLRKAAYYLEYTMGRSEAEELFSEAKNSSDRKARFSVSGYGHFKLKREDGQYKLAKSSSY
jgi:hypothetical protein